VVSFTPQLLYPEGKSPAAEIKYMGRTAPYTRSGYKKILDIIKELHRE
jgi:hypothetical protein